MGDSPIVFGSISKVNEYKKSKGLEITKPEPEKRLVSNSDNNAFQIGGSGDGSSMDVSDNELQLLDKVLLRGNPEDVFMQEDISFYDNYYLNDVKMDDFLTSEVRKIRRIYRNYTKYLYACYIRDKYFDALTEQYQMDTILKYSDQDVVRIPKDVYLPPDPIYSKNAEDYEKVMRGGYSPELPFDEPSEEEVRELLQSMIDASGINLDEVECDCSGVIVYKPALASYDEMYSDNSSGKRYSGPSSVNVTDLDNLQKMIRSWYKKEDDKKELVKNRIPFPNSEEGMRQQYLNEFSFYILDHIGDADDEEDENEMVYDDVSNKPMTRKEYNRRRTLRMLSDNSGWDMVKLMTQMNVGSKIERKMALRKRNRGKKMKKKAASFFHDVTGMSTDFDNPVTSVDDLRKYLFDD